jgi:hypothetical protein
MFFHKKTPHRTGCLVGHIIITVLLAVLSIAAFVGVVRAHFDPTDSSLIFGTPADSLAIIALAITLTLGFQQCKNCMCECDVCEMPPSKKK